MSNPFDLSNDPTVLAKDEGISVEILERRREPLLSGGYRMIVGIRDAESGEAVRAGCNVVDGFIEEENAFTKKTEMRLIHQAVGRLIERKLAKEARA